jgi:hypothetical protein
LIDRVEDMEMAFSPDVRFHQRNWHHCSNGGFWKPFHAGICSWFCFTIILLLLHMGYFRHSPDIKYCKSIQTRFLHTLYGLGISAKFLFKLWLLNPWTFPMPISQFTLFWQGLRPTTECTK